MKVPALLVAGALALGITAAPAAAQDLESDAATQTCARLTSTVPLDAVGPAELARLLLEGQLTVEVLDSDACLRVAEETEPVPGAKAGTPYVSFVARGAGAVIEAAALAQRHEGAKTLDDLDQAARDLHAWARTQRKWLDKHPPQACYADAHAQWRAGVVDVREGAKEVRRAIKRLKAAPMERAVRKLSAGTRKLTSVDFDTVTRDCAEAS